MQYIVHCSTILHPSSSSGTATTVEELTVCGEVMVGKGWGRSGGDGGLRSIPTVSSPQQHLMTPVLQLR